MKKCFLLLAIFLITNTIFSQEKKDSLFFYYDKEYLIKNEYSPNNLYPKDFQSDEGGLFFSRVGVYYNLNPKKIICLQNFLQSLKFKENDYHELTNYLYRRFELFLVKKKKGKTIYLKIVPGIEMI